MTASRWTNQAQRTGSARPANDQNIATINDLSASETIALILQCLPSTITIQPLQDLEFLRRRHFDGRQDGHGQENGKSTFQAESDRW